MKDTYTDEEIDAFVELGKSIVKKQLIINQVDKPKEEKESERR